MGCTMISPFNLPNKFVGDAGKQVSAYFPPAKWYDWFTYQVTSASGSEAITISTPLDHIPVSTELK